MSELDIKKWLKSVSDSVEKQDLDAHMNLVSENVAVYGMPSGQTIHYQDWKKRRKSEFKRDMLKSLSYNELKIKTIALKRLIFNINEMMESKEGDIVIINKDVVLEQEADQAWRVIEETVNNWQHMKTKKKSS